MGKYFNNAELDALWARLVTATEKLCGDGGWTGTGPIYEEDGYMTISSPTADEFVFPQDSINWGSQLGALPIATTQLDKDVVYAVTNTSLSIIGYIEYKGGLSNASMEGIHDALISHFELVHNNTPKTPGDYMRGIAVAARYRATGEVQEGKNSVHIAYDDGGITLDRSIVYTIVPSKEYGGYVTTKLSFDYELGQWNFDGSVGCGVVNDTLIVDVDPEVTYTVSWTKDVMPLEDIVNNLYYSCHLSEDLILTLNAAADETGFVLYDEFGNELYTHGADGKTVYDLKDYYEAFENGAKYYAEGRWWDFWVNGEWKERRYSIKSNMVTYNGKGDSPSSSEYSFTLNSNLYLTSVPEYDWSQNAGDVILSLYNSDDIEVCDVMGADGTIPFDFVEWARNNAVTIPQNDYYYATISYYLKDGSSRNVVTDRVYYA